MKEFDALVIAHYDFTDKKTGKKVHTSKMLVSLGEFGSCELCSELANDCELLSVVKVQLGYKNNKFVINSIAR